MAINHIISEAFRNIVYIDKGHKYFHLELKRKLSSVTREKAKYVPKFNRKYWLRVKAKEYGITEQELGREWDFLRYEGNTIGTLIHSYLELRTQRKFPVLDIPTDIDINRLNGSLSSAEQFIKDHDHFSPVERELVVGNHFVGGQIDYLAYAGEDLCLIDYKTDKQIRTENKWGKKLLPPFSHLDDCELRKYEIQTNFYKLIFEKETGLKIDKIIIVHISPKEYKIYNVDLWQPSPNILQLLGYK